MKVQSLENKAKSIVFEKLIKLAEKFPFEDGENITEDHHWVWEYISENPNLSIEIINKYPNKEWDWGLISKNKNITMENIVNNPTEPFFWNWLYISINPNLTIEMIENNPNESWNWYKILNHSFKKEYDNELKKLQND